MRAIVFFFLTAFLVCSSAIPGQTQAADAQHKPTPEQTPDESMSPLMRAAAGGRLNEVRNLLKAGADVNEKGALGITTLMFAAGAGHLQVVKALVEAGADPNAAGGVVHGGFFSVLTVAMTRENKNRTELMDILIAAGAKVNPPRCFPESPLDAAVKERDIQMLKALLERGADVNWENEIGTTPLETAVSMGQPDVEVVRLLLKAGADPNRPRLWEGDVCVSLLQAFDKGLSRDKVREGIRRLLKQSGAKKYIAKSHGMPCK
jgi:ankyrin repeat protein